VASHLIEKDKKNNPLPSPLGLKVVLRIDSILIFNQFFNVKLNL